MARVRLGVVIVVPEPVGTEVDGLRRALGDPVLDRIMPHLTLVPPVNVRTDDLPAALAVLRAAAAAARALHLEVGAPRTFGPGSPTLFLPVEGAADELDELARLRGATFVAPLHRVVDHEFVPHVTIAMELEPVRLAAGIGALADYRRSFVADRVTLLRYAPGRGASGDGPGATIARWEPIADACFGPPAVVGRGGIELELTASSILDPEAAALVAGAESSGAGAGTGSGPSGPVRAAEGDVAPGARRIVITARRRGAVVGVGWADAWPGATPGRAIGDIVAIEVAPDAADEGVERQITMALQSAIASA